MHLFMTWAVALAQSVWSRWNQLVFKVYEFTWNKDKILRSHILVLWQTFYVFHFDFQDKKVQKDSLGILDQMALMGKKAIEEGQEQESLGQKVNCAFPNLGELLGKL